MSETTFENKCDILADFYIEYKGDSQFSDFFDYNDLGLPLAYALSSKIVLPTELSTSFIVETFDLLLEVLGIQDTGFETLQDIVTLALGE